MKEKNFKLLSIILILIIIALLAYILYMPISDYLTKKFNSNKIINTDESKIKEQISIEKFNFGEKETVLITNNSDKTIYNVNVMGYFSDHNNKPLYTDNSTYMFFIPAGETVAAEMYCYGEDGKFTKFKDCIVDIDFSLTSDTVLQYYIPMSDKIELVDQDIVTDGNFKCIKGSIKNNSENKLSRADLIAILYKDGIPVGSTSGSVRNISGNDKREAIFTPVSGIEFDSFNIFCESCYRYSYN